MIVRSEINKKKGFKKSLDINKKNVISLQRNYLSVFFKYTQKEVKNVIYSKRDY